MGSIGRITRQGNLKPDIEQLKRAGARQAAARESIEATGAGLAAVGYGATGAVVAGTAVGVLGDDE